MSDSQPQAIYRKDYTVPTHLFDSVGLNFDLGDESTTVTSKIQVSPNAQSNNNSSLQLVGASPEEMVLRSVLIDGKALSEDQYTRHQEFLTLHNTPATPFLLEISVQIKPQENTDLEGLYQSSGNFCTQCEAEGFRRITFFLDRPDVMSKYTVRIVAEKQKYPVLLSNGNLMSQGDLEGGQHFVTWEDPFKKPSYLFALVAGKLSFIEDHFVTLSGRRVTLRIYCEAHNISKCDYAMESLKKAMKWDEEKYGLEYDLDLFNIVAVDDFNMGAMENKSLNIFNSRLVLASPKTATDLDYGRIEGVIGHEYFHNWTGNRVTCRDWFQLSLKEGLTVFRDQEFSADLNSRGVKRITEVALLRQHQFIQDSGPMAHPVRPDSYIKMDNFYTVTVYEKGAEVVRMYQTIFGVDGFRKGMDLYFQRHDGQAVTCDDFYQAMIDANGGKDLEGFKNWYSQAGTPKVKITNTHYDAEKKTYTLTVEQVLSPSPGQPTKQPQLIPIATGLLDPEGHDMSLLLDGESSEAASKTKILPLNQLKQTFQFTNVASKPVPSFLRDFSAPVRLDYKYSLDEICFLVENDTDEFAKWESAQKLFTIYLISGVWVQLHNNNLTTPELDSKLFEVVSAFGNFENANSLAEISALLKEKNYLLNALKKILGHVVEGKLDRLFVSTFLGLPSESEILELIFPLNPIFISNARKQLQTEIAVALESLFVQIVQMNENDEEYKPDMKGKSSRALKNTSLHYLSLLDKEEVTKDLLKRMKEASNMTDQIASFTSLVLHKESKEREEGVQFFFDQWKEEKLVLLKWYTLVASSNMENNLTEVKKIWDSSFYDKKNPNSIYSLLGGFFSSSVNFHKEDGSGYEFLANVILEIDSINAQVAARMSEPFTRWRKYDTKRQEMIKQQAGRILEKKDLSKNVFEIISKTLSDS